MRDAFVAEALLREVLCLIYMGLESIAGRGRDEERLASDSTLGSSGNDLLG